MTKIKQLKNIEFTKNRKLFITLQIILPLTEFSAISPVYIGAIADDAPVAKPTMNLAIYSITTEEA